MVVKISDVVHCEVKGCFTLDLGEAGQGVLEYERVNLRMVVVHTEVSKSLRGRGVAAVLVEAALAEARRRGWQVEARCSYVARYLERHPPADHSAVS